MPSSAQAGQGGLRGQRWPHLTGLAGRVVGHHLQLPPGGLGQIPGKTNLRPWLMREDFIGDCDPKEGRIRKLGKRLCFQLATTMVNWLLYHIGSSEGSMKASQDPFVEVNYVPNSYIPSVSQCDCSWRYSLQRSD